MTKDIPNAGLSKVPEAPLPVADRSLPLALEDLRMSVDRLCLLAGVEALGEMLAEDACQGGKVKLSRPQVHVLAGKEVALPSWAALWDPDFLRGRAMNLMVLTVSTRKYRRAVQDNMRNTKANDALEIIMTAA